MQRIRRLLKLPKTAVRLRVQGQLNQKLSDQICLQLQKLSPSKVDCILVTINSMGDTLPSAQHIACSLTDFHERHKVPVYCFAQDVCLGSAAVVLAAGCKSYANSMTLLGNIGFAWNKLWFHNFAREYGVKMEYIHAGQNKVMFNVFEEIKPESREWMQERLCTMERELKNNIYLLRKKQFQHRNLSRQEVGQRVLRSDFIKVEQAVEDSLIDGIMNMDQYLEGGKFKLKDPMVKKGMDQFKTMLSVDRIMV